jgi:hypothetical protein
LKWSSLKAKIGKMKKSKFGRFDSWKEREKKECSVDFLFCGLGVVTLLNNKKG